MQSDRQRKNWIIDAVLFAGLLIAMWLDLTGVALHEWLGAAVVALAAYHLLVHWRWVETVTRRLFGRTSGQARSFYLIDWGMLVGFLTIGLTGLAISTWLNLPLGDYLFWRDAHVISSVATLGLVVLKIGLHWRWIVSVYARTIAAAPAVAVPARPARPVPVPVRIGRRDFARLMSVVGASALLASVNALNEGTVSATASADLEPTSSVAKDTQALAMKMATPAAASGASSASAPKSAASSAASPTPTKGTASSPASPTATSTAASSAASPTATTSTASSAASSSATSTTASKSTASACVVQCSKGCSYPGRCRRYKDANQNQRCDLGECA